MTTAIAWKRPYCGVQHSTKTDDGRWATVITQGSAVELLLWYPGCGFNPSSRTFPTVEEARREGEAWLASV